MSQFLKVFWCLSLLGVCTALHGCGVSPSGEQAAKVAMARKGGPSPQSVALGPMTFEAAISRLQSASRGYTLNRTLSGGVANPQVRVNGDQLEIDLVDGTWVCRFTQATQPDIDYRHFQGTLNMPCSGGVLTAWTAADEAPSYLAAWNKMRSLSAPETPAEAAAFEASVVSFRAGSVGPEIGEDVRPYKVQAELAVREKRPWDATERFEAGLAIAPWWPQGNFNVALIYGELGAYTRAERYMRRYLKLVPDAANARAAQDKIYQWQGQAGR